MGAKVTLTFESGKVVENEVGIETGEVTSKDILRSLPYTERLATILEENPKAVAEVLNGFTAGRTDGAVTSARKLGLIDKETQDSPDAVMLLIINLLLVPPSGR